MIAPAQSPVTGYARNIHNPGTLQSRMTQAGLFQDDIYPTVDEAIFFVI
jgi:hypothetical protein